MKKKFLVFIGLVLLGIGIIVWMNKPVTDVDEVTDFVSDVGQEK